MMRFVFDMSLLRLGWTTGSRLEQTRNGGTSQEAVAIVQERKQKNMNKDSAGKDDRMELVQEILGKRDRFGD